MIYAFGSNGCGQLGIGHQDDTAEPQLVKFHENDVQMSTVSKIVAGGNHTLMLCKDGTVYAAGNNEDGRCGVAGGSTLSVMQKIPLENICDISATWSASFFIATDRQSLYTCGTGDHGELGLGKDVTRSARIVELAKFHDSNITHISSSVSHTVVVLENGQVWAWGKGRKGQLGAPSGDQWLPRELAVPYRAISAAAGSDFTCVLGQSAELLVFGSDKSDRFRLRADMPDDIPHHTILLASWCTAYAYHPGESLIAWGRQDRGQVPPHNLPPLIDFAAGSEHWLALSPSGEVVTGGWGEHGNCGAETDKNGVVKDRFNHIATQHAVRRVFAGCATSFLVADDPPHQSNIP